MSIFVAVWTTQIGLSRQKAPNVFVNWPQTSFILIKLITAANRVYPGLNLQHLQSAQTRNNPARWKQPLQSFSSACKPPVSLPCCPKSCTMPGRTQKAACLVQISTSLNILTFPPLEHLRYALVAPAVWFMAKTSAKKQ